MLTFLLILKILFSDQSSHPTTTVQNKMNKMLDQLILSSALTKDEGKKLKCINGVFPKLYCLPKIHKEDIPLRPIVSFVGSPTYQLTKFLAGLIECAFEKDQYYTKNSFEVVESLQGFQLPPNHVLVSLDVISLFTNIPTDLVITVLTKKWDLIKDKCTLTLQKFVEILEFVFENSFFNFNGQFYKQVFGLGMGNCLSPVCADIIMSELQKTCINQLPFELPFFKRYVDDIITCVPFDQIDTLLNTFNSFHSKLQFTIERESNNSIAFLDILLIRSNNNTIKTDWYQKPTFSERFLNYNSHHSFKQKLNIIHNLKNRALRLSHADFHNKNLLKIKSFLLKNDYPHRLIKRTFFRPNQTTNRQNPIIQQKKFYKIPYIKKLSEKLARELNNENVNIAFKNENTTKRFFSKLKTETPKTLESNVIYKIPCSMCQGVYIGQTSRYFKTRICEHQRSIRPHVLVNTTSKTALAEHFEKFQHPFDFENTEILARQQNYKKRLLSEMIQIRKHPNHINKKQDVDNLSNAYFSLINSNKKP